MVDLLRISAVEKDSELLLGQEELEAWALLDDLVNLESLPELIIHLKAEGDVPLKARQSAVMGLHKVNDHLDGDLLSFRQGLVAQAQAARQALDQLAVEEADQEICVRLARID